MTLTKWSKVDDCPAGCMICVCVCVSLPADAAPYPRARERVMAISRVQFQRGLPRVEFMSLHDTEAKYHRSLYRARWTAGLRCPTCGDRARSQASAVARRSTARAAHAAIRRPCSAVPKGRCWRLEVRRAACEVRGACWVNILKPQARAQRQRPRDLAGMAEIEG